MITHAALIDEEFEHTGRVKIRKLDRILFTPSKPIAISEEMPGVIWGMLVLLGCMAATLCVVVGVSKKKWIQTVWKRVKTRAVLRLGRFDFYRRLDEDRVMQYEMEERDSTPIPYITREESERLRELVGEEYLASEHNAISRTTTDKND
tara:strand:+ start:936 stop:1382 length:447 start_codon:yes stop_codon:yes gene_type:complete